MDTHSKTSAKAALAALVEALQANPLGGGLFRDGGRPIAILNLDGTVVEFNRGTAVGRPALRAAPIGAPWWTTLAFASPEWEQTWRHRFALAGSSPDPIEFDDSFAIDGVERLELRFRLWAVRDAAGDAIGYVVETFDVEHLRDVERRLRETERLRKLTFEQSYQLMAILDPDGTVRDVNAVLERLGLSRAAMIGRRMPEIAAELAGDPARAQTWERRLDDVRGEGTQKRYFDFLEFAGLKHPRTMAVESTVSPVRDDHGRLQHLLVEWHDRSDSYAAEQTLRESEARFRALAETLPQMVWSSGPDGLVDYYGPRWETFTGKPVAELLGRGFIDLVHPDDRAMLVARAVQRERLVEPFQFRMRRHDGAWRWMEGQRAGVLEGPDGEMRWFGATLDITERREAEDDARRREEQLRATLELTGYGTYAWEVPEDRFTADSELEKLYGEDRQDLKTGDAFALFFASLHPDDREATTQAVLEALVPGGPDYEAEFRVLRPTHQPEVIWVSAMGRVEFNEHGAPMRLVGVFSDITLRRVEAEARLRVQKLEALGTLAGGIAHDFNNVIGAILSFARLAEAEVSAGQSPTESLAEIARGAQRAGDIVQRLLTFSRDEPPRRVAFNLGEVVDEARALLRPVLPRGVELHVSIAPDLPDVFGDPSQLYQVAVNLLTNAGQAIGLAHGAIELSVDRAWIDEQRAAEAGLSPGKYLLLRVRDEGDGMDDDVASRIFDPFFTTKGPKDGTGLGLAAVQSIVRNHGGGIVVESRAGHGATFSVYLPFVEAPAGAPAPSSAAAVQAAGDPPVRVLFVDDEDALVRLAHRAMPYRGFTVTGFTDPGDALAALQATPDAFDALVSDFSMPTMTGLELAERARALRPDLAIVLTSGYMGPDAHADARGHGVDSVVPKPCSIDDLADEILRLRSD